VSLLISLTGETNQSGSGHPVKVQSTEHDLPIWQ